MAVTYSEATQYDNNDIFAIFLSGKNKDETDWDGMKIHGTITTSAAPSSSTYSASASASVGVTSALAVAANTNRKGLVLTSLLSNTGQIALSGKTGIAAQLNKGQILYPGDSFTMDDRTFTTDGFTAISDVAAQTLAIQETI